MLMMAADLPFLLCLCLWVAGVNSGALLKLVDGPSKEIGNVEIQSLGISYRVCDEGWTNAEATVVCRTMGLNLGGVAKHGSFFGTPSGAIELIDSIKCNGTEVSFAHCSMRIDDPGNNCDDTKLAGVICTMRVPCGLRPYDKTKLRGRGRSYRGKRIVGGRDAAVGEYPWFARIMKLKYNADGSESFTHLCGGTVISEYWILTAAHCLYNLRTSSIKIVVGDNGRNSTGAQHFFAKKKILYWGFTLTNHEDDIALLMVRGRRGQGIVFNYYVQPACTAFFWLETPGTIFEVAGWGRTDPRQMSPPSVLQGVSVRLMGIDQCNRIHLQRTGRPIRGYHVCTEPGRRNPCRGDSGGPLVRKLKGFYTLLGITSWAGERCVNVPPVYTKVSSYLIFIVFKIKYNSETPREWRFPEPYYIG